MASVTTRGIKQRRWHVHNKRSGNQAQWPVLRGTDTQVSTLMPGVHEQGRRSTRPIYRGCHFDKLHAVDTSGLEL